MLYPRYTHTHAFLYMNIYNQRIISFGISFFFKKKVDCVPFLQWSGDSVVVDFTRSLGDVLQSCDSIAEQSDRHL